METDFDFHEWACLAKTDPEAFEQLRAKCIDQFICASGKHKRRLEGLQFKIDAKRKLSHTADKALVVISQMMVKSLNELGDELKSLSHDAKNPSVIRHVYTAVESPSCKVLPLLPRHDRSPDRVRL